MLIINGLPEIKLCQLDKSQEIFPVEKQFENALNGHPLHMVELTTMWDLCG